MSNVRYDTSGNLALIPRAVQKPRFVVIDGAASMPEQPRHLVPTECGTVVNPTRIITPSQAPVSNSIALTLARRIIAGFVIGIAFASLLFAGHIASASISAAHDDALASTQFSEVEVRGGDSLWAIAEAHSIDGLSTQQTSDVIREVNDLASGALVPGMTLLVPNSLS